MCVLFRFVQRLCNGGAVLLQLLHRGVKSSAVDVEVAARGAQVRVPEDFADERDRDASFLES